MSGVIYVAYTGALEPLGRSQVLAYLRGLAARGTRISLITFEKKRDWASLADRSALALRLAAAGIEWRPHLWRPSLAGKLLNVVEGVREACVLARQTGARTFHARSHVAGVIALLAAGLMKGALLFDLRGELAEEYADSGHWQRDGLLYRSTRLLERALLTRSQAVVVLTERLRREIEVPSGTPVTVVPCCVDRSLFRPRLEDKPTFFAQLAGRPVLVYAGSLGTWYLLDEMVALFARASRVYPDLHFLVLTNGPSEPVLAAAHRVAAPAARVHVRAVPYEEVPTWLTWCRAGLSFIAPTRSKRGSSPTKLAEYLACGLPLVANSGVGDLDGFVEKDGVGILMESFEQEQFDRAIRYMAGATADDELRRRCMRVAERRFDLLDVGVARYLAVYRALGAA